MFAIGDKEWPGTSKLMEEMGELQQVLGKLMGSRGDPNHWSGDLNEKLIEELGDLKAAITFFIEKNLDIYQTAGISEQFIKKLARFRGWHITEAEQT